MTFNVKPENIFYTLWLIIGILTILNFTGIGIIHFTDLPKIEKHVVRLIDFNKEGNIPAFWSALSLGFAALLLGYLTLINKYKDDYKQWFGLFLLFVFLALDEAASFHELLSGPVRELLDLEGVLYLAWVIPYILLILALLGYYIRFLLRLSFAVRVMFIVAGIIYILGAIGCELIANKYYIMNDSDDLGYAMIYSAEELLEMTGIAIFIYSIFFHIQMKFHALNVNISIEKLVQTPEQKKMSERRIINGGQVKKV